MSARWSAADRHRRREHLPWVRGRLGSKRTDDSASHMSHPTPALFLLGAPRSGTTLLYKTLCLHPDAAWFSNWLRRAPRFYEIATLNRIARMSPSIRREVWFAAGNAYAYGRARGLVERAFPQPVEGEPVFAACGVPAPPSPPRVPEEAMRLLGRAFGLVREYGGGRCLVNKRIANNQRIPILDAACPDSRFVHLVRDGRAVAYSCTRVDWWRTSDIWWYGGTPVDWESEGGDPWDLCARNWVEELRSIEDGLSTIPDARRLEVTYEALVADPVGSLVGIAAFAGLTPDPGWISELESLPYPDRNEGWRTELDGDTVDLVTKVQLDELTRYGYRTD